MQNDTEFKDVRAAAQRDVQRMIESIETAEQRVKDRKLPTGFGLLVGYLAECDKMSLMAYLLVAYEAGRIESESVAMLEQKFRRLDS